MGRNHVVQKSAKSTFFCVSAVIHIDKAGFVWLQWDHSYPRPDADFHADQDPYTYSDAHSLSHPDAPAHRVDSLAYQRYLGLQ